MIYSNDEKNLSAIRGEARKQWAVAIAAKAWDVANEFAREVHDLTARLDAIRAGR